MENPTFRLEGIVKTRDDMEDFEGPLTLILQLLSKNKIEIKDIQISLLLDQYLEYLEEMKAMDLEIASEFVAMASHLVYIKTKMLLDSDKEVSELEELITSLENLKARDNYAAIKAVTDIMLEMSRRGAGLITKTQEPIPNGELYKYLHDKSDLTEALGRVFAKDDSPAQPVSQKPFVMPSRVVYSVTDKAREILVRIRMSGTVYAKSFFSETQSKTELVATFIAMLELCKAGRISLVEANDDFIISFATEAKDIDVREIFGENENNGNS